jgi:hypothetical protein
VSWQRCFVIATLSAAVTWACDRGRGREETSSNLLSLPVVGTTPIEIDAFAANLSAAQSHGDAWTDDPYMIAARLFSPPVVHDAVWRFVGDGPHPTRLQVVLVTDGLPDDSIRGRRYEARLELVDTGHWIVRDPRTSWRCWRARENSFGATPCP